MTTTKTLSAILYSHNSAQTIAGALDAVLRASLRPAEIIVIDDASRDASVERITAYLRRHGKIRLVRNREPLGQSGSLSRALGIASGDYVYAATAASRVRTTLFEEAASLLRDFPQAGFCCADADTCDDAGRVTGALRPRWGGMARYVPPHELLDLVQSGDVDPEATVFDRKTLLEHQGFLRELEWLAPWFSILVIGFRHGVCYVPKTLAASGASPGPRPSTAQSADVLVHLLRLLRAERYYDVLGFFVAANLLAKFSPQIERIVLGDPEHWEAESLLLIQRPLDLAALKNRGRCILERGKAAIAAGRLGQAQDIFGAGAREMPDLPIFHVLEAKVALDRGDSRTATAAITRAAELAPGEAAICLQRGIINEHAGDLDAAEEAYRAASVCDSEGPQACVALAGLLQQRGRNAEAARLYNEQLPHHPDNLPLLTGVGQLAVKLGQPEVARLAFRHVLALDPCRNAARTVLAELEAGEPAGSPSGGAGIRRGDPPGSRVVRANGRPPDPDRTAFHVVTVVWGEQYRELFLRMSLRTQLASGNLPALGGRPGCVYRIYTTPTDAEAIRRSRAYEALACAMPTDLVSVDDLDVGDKYVAANECHRQAIQAANAAGAAVIAIPPDAAISDGAFARVAELADAGMRAVMIAGTRVQRDAFLQDVLTGDGCRHWEAAGGSLSSRELVRLTLAHAHPITQALFWDATDFSEWPSHLYWRVGHHGMLARCFHLHPLMVRPVRTDVLPSTTIDDRYVTLACPDPADVYVVEDSDEIVGVSLNAEEDGVGETTPKGASVFRVARWAQRATTALHRDLARRRIRFHAEDLGTEWEAAERASDDVMERILFFFRGLRCPTG